MKFYESTYEDYINQVQLYTMHPELHDVFTNLPSEIEDFENTIVYGPPGVGKYSQVLSLLKRYSPTNLKYDKRIVSGQDRLEYQYRISDIHYEIDMAMLGCNSKTIWHDIFFQIVDIISVKQKKVGIIVCKNFHSIHSELLDVFYSYIQQYNHSQTNILVKFCMITENISFIPSNITNSCHILNIKRPSHDTYKHIANMYSKCSSVSDEKSNHNFVSRLQHYKSSNTMQSTKKCPILENISPCDITNIKELRSFDLITDPSSSSSLPCDVFNTVCDQIIHDTYHFKTVEYTAYRDSLYNMLTYNLDISECLWYIITHFIENQMLTDEEVSDILQQTYSFFKFYNNNYRPIYHLESIMFYIINKIGLLDEPTGCI